MPLNNAATAGQAPADPNADPHAALMAFISGQGPRPDFVPTPRPGAAQVFDLSGFGGAPPAAAQAQPPAGGQAQAPPAMAAAPPTMPPPMFAMPQMYAPGQEPVNVQMQQLPNGMSVDASQAGAAKHALGMDRLPDFDTYARTHRSTLPGQVWQGGGVDPRFGGSSPAEQQQQVLQQYLAMQKVQSQGDQDATARMTAGDTGAYQRGLVGNEAQANSLRSYQASLPYMGALTAMQGINSGAVDSFQAQKNQALIAQMAGGVGGAPGMAPAQGGAAPAGPMQQPPGSPPPHAGQPLTGADPAALNYAFDSAAKEGAPKGPDGKPMPRSQADTVIQFDLAHQGLLKKDPQAFNSLAEYLSREGQGGEQGLQKLWRTTQPMFPSMAGPPTSEQRAQAILQQAMQAHTGQDVPTSGNLFGINTGTLPSYYQAGRVQRAAPPAAPQNPVTIREHGFRP